MKEKVLDETPATIGDVKRIAWLGFQHYHRFNNLYPKASVFAFVGGLLAYPILDLLHVPYTHFAWMIATILVLSSFINLIDHALSDDYDSNKTLHAESPRCINEDEDYNTPKYLRSSDTKEKK